MNNSFFVGKAVITLSWSSETQVRMITYNAAKVINSQREEDISIVLVVLLSYLFKTLTVLEKYTLKNYLLPMGEQLRIISERSSVPFNRIYMCDHRAMFQKLRHLPECYYSYKFV